MCLIQRTERLIKKGGGVLDDSVRLALLSIQVNKSWPVIRSLGLGKMTEAVQEKGMTRGGGGGGGGVEFITTVPACRDM